MSGDFHPEEQLAQLTEEQVPSSIFFFKGSFCWRFPHYSLILEPFKGSPHDTLYMFYET